METRVSVIPTMDCEPVRGNLSERAVEMSPSGPDTPAESKRSIRGYVEVAAEYGYTPTLFVHPEVAHNHPEFLLNLQDRGVCLGLHVHPYKLSVDYDYDLGAYPATEQREILERAVDEWTDALGQRPRYFRGGKFSANDNTVRLLRDMDFDGGSLSNVGRVLPEGASIWAGAEPYPHRAHEGFRQMAGDSEFVEVPALGDASRPLAESTSLIGEGGYETLYVPSNDFGHEEIVHGLLDRFERDEPEFPVLVLVTHNDMEYTDPDHYARRNYEKILDTIASACEERSMRPVRRTVADVVEEVRAAEG